MRAASMLLFQLQRVENVEMSQHAPANSSCVCVCVCAHTQGTFEDELQHLNTINGLRAKSLHSCSIGASFRPRGGACWRETQIDPADAARAGRH